MKGKFDPLMSLARNCEVGKNAELKGSVTA